MASTRSGDALAYNSMASTRSGDALAYTLELETFN